MRGSESVDAGPAVAVAHAYVDAFSARDAAGQAAHFNYPHVRLAGSRVEIWKTAEEFIAEEAVVFERSVEQGWHRSTLDEVSVVHSGPDKVHLVVQLARWDAQGNRLATLRSLWIVTVQAGHWGIQARSSFPR